ncbi:MAG: 30S ribosomal protein S8 [Candidatus Taylorbacteria bacterium]|nr:30S ribosomal protein S8 [Candidatus Taylorbacteria bacterium]
MVTDPLSSFIVGLKNAAVVRKEFFSFPYSRLILELSDVLRREGYLSSVSKRGKKGPRFIELKLARKNGENLIHGAKRLSSPSRRQYLKANKIYPLPSGGIMIISTTKGLLTGQEVRRERLGGEPLCAFW